MLTFFMPDYRRRLHRDLQEAKHMLIDAEANLQHIRSQTSAQLAAASAQLDYCSARVQSLQARIDELPLVDKLK